MSLRRRVARLEERAKGLWVELVDDTGAAVRCTEAELLGLLVEVQAAARERREPEHWLLQPVLRAKPGQDPLADLIRALALSYADEQYAGARHG